jgi:hypothetical protein
MTRTDTFVRIMAPFLTTYDYIHYLTLSKFISPLVNRRLSQLGLGGEKHLPLFDPKKPVSYGALRDLFIANNPGRLHPVGY